MIVQTYTGAMIDLLAPDPNLIHIGDIAHALAMLCRFNGHVSRFYSVAQHSVWVSDRMPPGGALEGLLHDAAEAYIGDLVTPIKRSMPTFIHLESLMLDAIQRRFSVSFDRYASAIEEADRAALGTEARDLMCDPDWAFTLPKDSERLQPMGPTAAEALFIRCFHQISVARAA